MFTALFTSALLLGAAPKVVSPEWNAVNVKKELVTFYADVLADALRKQGLQVVTAQDIATLLGMERQRELVGCNDAASSCMAELASALGCDATLMVNLARFDDGGFRGIAKVISSKTGNTLASAQLDSSSERRLLDSLEAAAKVLAVPFGSSVTPAPEVTKNVASKSDVPLWWIPGAIGVVVGGASVPMFVVSQADYESLSIDETLTTRDLAQDRADRGSALQTGGWIAAGVGVGLVATSIVLLALPKSDVVPTAVVTPTGGAVGLGGRF